MKKFRLLKAEEIECRVNTCNNNGCSLLLYKTARTDADLLDETVGPENWENDFKEIGGVLYGGIGIREDGKQESDYYLESDYIWKWDAGTESNTEAEKGRASDAFKRAGFKWGIGRELYSAPFIWIPASLCNIKEGKNGKPTCNDHFSVVQIQYTDDRISLLQIFSREKNVIVYSYPMEKEKPFDPDKAPEHLCADCKNPLNGYKATDGTAVSVEQLRKHTEKRFGRPLCRKCAAAQEMKDARAEREA